jgi:DNA-binding transcriptional regulator LsrR (DeoR family)
MVRIDELRLMAKIAHLYYELGLRQPAIAAQLEHSQATVSRLLKRAREEGIVHISINQPQGAYPELEEAIQDTYGLRDVIVADSTGDSDDEILRGIGSAAAYYLETTLNQGEVVGISSWSETLLAMVRAMSPLSRPSGARVVQILGGIGNPATEFHATNLTRRLADLLRGEAVFLPAPGVVASVEMRTLFLKDQYVSEANGLFAHMTLALVGIGAVEPSRMLAGSGNVFSAQELDLLRLKGAVGDICLHFLDAHGTPLQTPLNERVIGIDLFQLRKVKRAVGVAGGARKVAAIRGVLEGKWINILITDRFTAARLLKP